jgi:hypothetical protein
MEELYIYSEQKITIPKDVWVLYCKKWVREKIKSFLPDNMAFCEDFNIEITDTLGGAQIISSKENLSFLSNLFRSSSEKCLNSVTVNPTFLYIGLCNSELAMYIVKDFDIFGDIVDVSIRSDFASSSHSIYSSQCLMKVYVRLRHGKK